MVEPACFEKYKHLFDTYRFALRNGPFEDAKRSISAREMDCFATSNGSTLYMSDTKIVTASGYFVC